VDAAHEIFREPFPVKLDFEAVPTPKHYRDYPEGKSLPDTMQVWRVQVKPGKQVYGLVSDPYGFTDSPDCEFISGGINSKGPNSVAIGRQGNWFLWGFSAPPSSMTESARMVFLNAIVYMKRFDGQAPLVLDPVPSRTWAEVYAGWYAAKPGFDIEDHSRQCFTKGLLDANGGDLSKLAAFVAANRAWIRVAPGTEQFDLDAEAKSLGIAVDDPALIERCVSMLEKGERADLAGTLLARYVDAKPGADAKAWRGWLRENRARLYFTERGGYRFRVRP
jgi:hypothetical protein